MTMNYKAWKYTGLIATVVIVLSYPAFTAAEPASRGLCKNRLSSFTGGKSCIECHQKEYRLWKGSDHDKAMDVATDSYSAGQFQ